jgi:hypothetical protein
VRVRIEPRPDQHHAMGELAARAAAWPAHISRETHRGQVWRATTDPMRDPTPHLRFPQHDRRRVPRATGDRTTATRARAILLPGAFDSRADRCQQQPSDELVTGFVRELAAAGSASMRSRRDRPLVRSAVSALASRNRIKGD